MLSTRRDFEGEGGRRESHESKDLMCLSGCLVTVRICKRGDEDEYLMNLESSRRVGTLSQKQYSYPTLSTGCKEFTSEIQRRTTNITLVMRFVK